MAKNKRKNRGKKQGESLHYEDYYDLRKTTKRPTKHRRVKDKKYLKDMMRGDIDIESYHDYNGN
tara:strand:- start:1129 stop:1320 length:192 start_codon:yes stop_codon:yes gene_type:complete